MESLILLSLQGKANAEQEGELLAWRQAAPANEALYQDFRRVWNVAELGAMPAASAPPSVARILRATEQGDARAAHGRGRSRIPRLAWMAGAAAAAALALFVIADLRQPAEPRGLGWSVEEFVTGETENATVRLRDGTYIRLAPRSRLRLTGTLDRREVALEGRAYFAVSHQEGRPFRIETEGGDVTVLGTRFDLIASEQELQLVVVEGRVSVAAGGVRAEVAAGEMGRVLEGNVLPVSKVPDTHELVAWKGRFLAFQATPLGTAMREIEREYGVDITITDSTLADRTITTWLSDRSLEEVIRIVCAVAVVECVTSNETITVAPATIPN